MSNHEYRVQRGRLLNILYRQYPDGVREKILSLTFDELGMSIPNGILKGHCNYLKGKGYIKMKSFEDAILHKDYESKYTCKITPRGIDLMEGNIEVDPGIEL